MSLHVNDYFIVLYFVFEENIFSLNTPFNVTKRLLFLKNIITH